MEYNGDDHEPEMCDVHTDVCVVCSNIDHSDCEADTETTLDYDGEPCNTPSTHEDCNGWFHCGAAGGCCGACPHCGQ